MARAIRFWHALPIAMFAVSGCLPAAPKIEAIPATGLAVRVFVFGAEAVNGRTMFDSVRASNLELSFVRGGGAGEILVGLDRDEVRCVEPTAYCEFRVALRIRDAEGVVVHNELTKIGESAESCSMLCDRAMQKVATYAVKRAAVLLGGSSDTGAPVVGKKARIAAKKKKRRSRTTAPVLCGIAKGRRLAGKEAESRIAQVDALNRQGILEPAEHRCLHKAFLSRL